MDANEPTGLQIKLADLIEAMRKLCIAARTHEPGTTSVTDARGAALALLTSDGTFL